MNKSLLVVLCLLAFAAGGAAHLVLQRASAPVEVKGEFVEAKPEPAAPAAASAEARPLPAHAAEAEAPATEEAKTEEAKTEEAKPAAAPAEPAKPAAVAPPPARRAIASRAATRPQRARAVPPPPPPPAPADTRETADGGRGLRGTTVDGAKKTGKLVGKGLKKLGGIFHD